MKNYRINWSKIAIAIAFILLALLLVGCKMDGEKSEIKIETEKGYLTSDHNKTWVEGRFYYNRGKDTTIYSQPFDVIEFNRQTEKYDTNTYQKRVFRQWEHKYTAGGMREDIYYWDEKSETWYVFNRSGDYYVFRWINRFARLDNVKN